MRDFYLQNYKEIISALLTFIGTVLAIVSTLFILPIQMIVGKYSQDFVKKIIYDQIILCCYSILILIFAYNFTMLLYDAISPFIIVSIISGYCSVLIFIILILRIYYFLDVRKQIFQFTKVIKKSINNKKCNDIEKLLKDVDPIFDFAQKAIKDDRIEYFSFALEEIIDISKLYTHNNNQHTSQNNHYFMIVMQKFIDLKNAVSPNNHTKIMDNIVSYQGNLAIQCFNFEDSKIYPTNYSANNFVDNLFDIVLSKEMFKDTSTAPYTAIEQILKIGNKSIKEQQAGTVFHIINKLGTISKITSKLHHNYGNYISQRSNSAIILLACQFFEQIKELKLNDSIFRKQILKEIVNVMDDFYNDDYKHPYNTNISTFYYTTSTEFGISRLLVNMLNIVLFNKD